MPLHAPIPFGPYPLPRAPLPPERGPRRNPKGFGGFGGGGSGFSGGGAGGSWPEPVAPMRHPDPGRPVPSNGGTATVLDCNRTFNNPPYLCGGTTFERQEMGLTFSGASAVGCLSEQAHTPAHTFAWVAGTPIAMPTNHRTLIRSSMRNCVNTSPLNRRYRYDKKWTWSTYAATATPGPDWWPVPQGIPLVPYALPQDPNRDRGSPAYPPPVPVPVGPVLGPGPYPWAAGFGGGKPPAPARPSPKETPKPRNRERKFRSRLARLGVYLYRILDEISESAEIVDALYDALPDDVKKRWDRKSRGFVDQAGQYGIDGADWKLQALWHNWNSVDVDRAVKNIIKNHFEDKVIGAYSRYLPRNVVNSLNFYDASGQKLSHEAQIALKLKEVFRFLGLEE